MTGSNRGSHRLLKEGHGAMVRARNFVNVLPSIPLGAEFAKRYHVSPLSILEHCLDVVSLGKALNPQMLHTVCSPWNLDGTQMNSPVTRG